MVPKVCSEERNDEAAGGRGQRGQARPVGESEAGSAVGVEAAAGVKK